MTRNQICLAVALLAAVPWLAGCHSIRYYKQAVAGQIQILANARPIEPLLVDPAVSPLLRQRLRLVLEIRQFAQDELHLPADGNYLRYVDLHRRFVVWNVHAARSLSLEPKSWWYPIVGRLKYKGYFSESEAHRYARKLELEGYDVYVGGVAAYSTLGWFRDPVLNTFVFDEETELAELLFHELAHQRVFARGDTDFNEAFATAVAEEGLRRWLRAKSDAAALAKARTDWVRKRQFVDLVSKTRARLREVYDEKEAGAGPLALDLQLSLSAKRSVKEQLFDELRRDYERLKNEWGGYDRYDAWFRSSLNNAKLNTVDTYYKLVPAFQDLLQSQGVDLQKFYREAKALSALPKAERYRRLTERTGSPFTLPPASSFR
ncbi:MAG: aminopeptidase [Verrucomicrobiales bacterium]|nr:aminopeptidase [Verrucomicrobiales bacterium]